MNAFTLRIPEARMREHHARMRRVGAALLGACVLVAAAALYVSLNLAMIAVVAALGVVFAVDTLRRAARGLAARGDLVVTIDGRVVTEGRDDGAAAGHTAPLLSAQAFPDHVQVVVGQAPAQLRQIELPVQGDERGRLLEVLRGPAGLAVGERPPVGLHFAIGLTVVPAVVIAGFIAYRAVVLVAAVGMLAALQALGPEAFVAGLALLAGLAVVLVVRRMARGR